MRLLFYFFKALHIIVVIGVVLLKFASILFLISLLLLLPFTSVDNETLTVSSALVNQGKNKIIIDAGHGGFDGGAVAEDGTLEKDINLLIASNLKEFCKLGGFEVIMTRESDTGTEVDESDSISNRKKSDMKRRLAVIEENPDAIFVSIHLNKFTTSTASGAQVFYSKNHTNSEFLAECVQKTMVDLIQKENTRTIKQADNSIFLLKKSNIPSIIIECGFLSNFSELKLLKNYDYQRKIAFAIYCGILNYY